MAHRLDGFFDDDAEAAVRALWRRLGEAGVPSPGAGRPHLTFAMAGVIPPRTVAALRSDLRLLSLPDLWLSTLASPSSGRPSLWLGAVVDTELLAVHSAVHDVLAGAVRQPSAYHLPGSWLPHCTLASDLTAAQLAAGFAALLPVPAVRARIAEVGITDTRSGDVEVLMSR